MEEHEKHELIQSCENINDLYDAIEKIGEIKVRSGKIYPVEKTLRSVMMAYETGPLNAATRNYGIRQQILYIIYYEKMEQLIKSN